MDTITLYDFCMDWQMNVVSKDQLYIEFVSRGWEYGEFEKAAKKCGWFVTSMQELKESE